jgi:hypothetical protein
MRGGEKNLCFQLPIGGSQSDARLVSAAVPLEDRSVSPPIFHTWQRPRAATIRIPPWDRYRSPLNRRGLASYAAGMAVWLIVFTVTGNQPFPSLRAGGVPGRGRTRLRLAHAPALGKDLLQRPWSGAGTWRPPVPACSGLSLAGGLCGVVTIAAGDYAGNR